MKRLYYIATLAIALFASLPIQAQEEAGNTQQQQQRRRGPEASRGAREEEMKENGMPELTVRAQDMNERMTQHIGNARWMRVIYRQIDLAQLARRNLTRIANYKLVTLAQHFQLAEKVEHRALPDCRLMQQVYCKLKETAVQ